MLAGIVTLVSGAVIVFCLGWNLGRWHLIRHVELHAKLADFNRREVEQFLASEHRTPEDTHDHP